MRSIQPATPMPHRPRPADILLGAIGGGVIRIVLAVSRLWARVTRSPWHG